MHSATPATGTPTQPPGKTVAKNRPAPLTARPTHTPRTPHSQESRMLHCYIGVWRHTNLPRRQAGHESQVTNRLVCPSAFAGHAISNRHTSRLEIVVSHRKQNPALILFVTF